MSTTVDVLVLGFFVDTGFFVDASVLVLGFFVDASVLVLGFFVDTSVDTSVDASVDASVEAGSVVDASVNASVLGLLVLGFLSVLDFFDVLVLSSVVIDVVILSFDNLRSRTVKTLIIFFKKKL
jgi:hypothetical protein